MAVDWSANIAYAPDGTELKLVGGMWVGGGQTFTLADLEHELSNEELDHCV